MADFGKYNQAMKGSVKLLGAKEIADMFGALPKQINQYTLWKALWRKIGKQALNDAKKS